MDGLAHATPSVRGHRGEWGSIVDLPHRRLRVPPARGPARAAPRVERTPSRNGFDCRDRRTRHRRSRHSIPRRTDRDRRRWAQLLLVRAVASRDPFPGSARGSTPPGQGRHHHRPADLPRAPRHPAALPGRGDPRVLDGILRRALHDVRARSRRSRCRNHRARDRGRRRRRARGSGSGASRPRAMGRQHGALPRARGRAGDDARHPALRRRFPCCRSRCSSCTN